MLAGSKHPKKHSLPIPRGVEVGELGGDVVAAREVEGSGGVVLRTGGGLDVDAGTAGGGHPVFGGSEERGSHSPALEARVDDDPVEVRGLLASGNGTPAGVASYLAVHLSHQETIVAGFALGEAVVHQFNRHFDLLGIEEAGGPDQLLDRSAVGGLQAAADGDAGAISRLLFSGRRYQDGR